MKKLFSKKNLVIIVATLSLLLALTQFLRPKVKNYFDLVEKQQKEFKVNANVVEGDESLFISHPFPYGADPIYYAQIAVFLGLFISLLKTKRFAYSFFGVILFVLHFSIAYQLYMTFVRFPMSYFYNTPIYAHISVFVIMMISFWQAHLIFRYFQNILSKKLQ